jgi:hypothetical protein
MDHNELKQSAEILRDPWPEADPAERRYLLSAVGDALLNSFEAPAPPIFAKGFEDTNLFGRYDDDHFRIEMNANLFESSDPAEALDTYLHEYRHAMQSYEVTKSHGALAHEADSQQALRFERNQREYVSPEIDFQSYHAQPVEEDARQYSAKLRRELFALKDGPNK